jgi:hypothetical protein
LLQSCLLHTSGLTETIDLAKLYDVQGVKRIAKVYDVAKDTNQDTISAYFKPKRLFDMNEENLLDIISGNNKLRNIFSELKKNHPQGSVPLPDLERIFNVHYDLKIYSMARLLI